MRSLVGLLLAASLLPPAAFAQNQFFTLLPAAPLAPSARFDGTIAWDTNSQQLFLFGGQDTTPRNDLWSWSLTLRQWTRIPVAGPAPAARFGHTLVFDPPRRRLILFGGQASGFFSDVWAFNLDSTSWQQLSADNSGPSRRYGHSAIADTARDRMVISHGFTNSGRFDDTWAFDFARNSWRDISPSGTRPLRRCLHHAAYDAQRGQMYLYGGCSSGSGPCPQGDLWSFDLVLNRWTERTPRLGPPPREHYGMAFNADLDKLVLFGGNSNGLLNDLWEFDPLSSLWQTLPLQGETPSARHRHEAVYASDLGAVLFFGGSTADGLSSELWALGSVLPASRPTILPGGVVNAFSGLGGSVAPGEVVSLYGSALGPATGAAFQFDSRTGRLPTSGSGVSVTWDGIPAPLYFAQANQLNVQVPYELSGTPQATLTVTVDGQTGEPLSVPVAAAHPGLFPGVWNEDGTLNSPQNPALAGSIVILYATGQGPTSPLSQTGAMPATPYPEPAAPTSLRIAGADAILVFKGQAPGTAGVMQLNARIPDVHGVALPVTLTVGTVTSQTGVVVAVR